ncbi:RICIN domain-containing protein [Xanthobacter sp. 91]|uniref:RICIN domain-containing protein n=1 Tax=Xanthobacter sp. 91 TaxID=1117244 RepID=UPI0009DFD591|nr:RICIN domain-containing protein [Xanthobacter sp. 91]
MMRILMTAAAFCCVLVGGASAGELRPGHASNLCLDVKGGLDQSNGTSIIVFPCNGGDNQSFTFMGDGTIRAGRRCVDISGGAARAGDRVIIYSCNGGANQQWRVGANGEIIGQNNMCLDVPRFGGAGTGVVAWPCKSGGEDRSNQQWGTR